MNKLVALRNKLKNKKGFTLMEMLIVVAIIVILLAIAIPSFNSALTKSKVAADEANVRGWYAECMVDLMTDTSKKPTMPVEADYKYGFQMADGKIVVGGDSAETFTVTYTSEKAGATKTFGGQSNS